MTRTSPMSGTLEMRFGSSVSSPAAINFKAEFLAPLTLRRAVQGVASPDNQGTHSLYVPLDFPVDILLTIFYTLDAPSGMVGARTKGRALCKTRP